MDTILALAAIELKMRSPDAYDATAIRHVMAALFAKPEARLRVEPVVVARDAALASWAQRERGGRTLLFQRASAWHIAACGGARLKDAALLRDAGVRSADASALAKGLASADARLTPTQRARFDSFDGLLCMLPANTPPSRKH